MLEALAARLMLCESSLRGSGNLRVAEGIVFGVGSIGRGVDVLVLGERDEAFRPLPVASFGVDRPDPGIPSDGSERRDRFRVG